MKLFELRKNKHLSALQLAEHMGVSDQTIYNWEKGDSEPDIKAIIKLADFFNVSADFLLEINNENDIGKIRASINSMDRNQLLEIINKQLDLLLLNERNKK